jgi:hypothetical protein
MKFIFAFLLLLFHTTGKGQGKITKITNDDYSLRYDCYELIEKKLNSLDEIPYSMVDKFVFDIKSGKTISIRLDDVKYKTKLGFIFQSKDLGDTLHVYLLTLNKKILVSKKVTNDDYFLRYDPFRKSEDYFLVIQTKEKLDADSIAMTGCLGLVIVERVKKKGFRPMQKIRWEFEKN